jgi:enamine deaminase RidA (YjgF/YER057c/UK114 family)
MEIETRRGFVGKVGAMLAVVAGGAGRMLGHTQAAPGTGTGTSGSAGSAGQDVVAAQNAREARRSNHVYEGIYYFSGTGANDGYPKEDHVTPADPFEKHVTRTMEALKKSVERNGCSMDSILHLTVFFRVPPGAAGATVIPAAGEKADVNQEQYDALNKIYGTYFTQGKAPSRACLAVEWIPGDSLIEVVGSARVVG